MGCATEFFLVPTPEEGPKGQISLHFNFKVNFKDLKTKLCVFSKMKAIKHIRRDFHSLSWVMPQGLGLGGAGGQKI